MRAGRQDLDLDVLRQVLGDVASMLLGAAVDVGAVPLNDDRDLHCRSSSESGRRWPGRTRRAEALRDVRSEGGRLSARPGAPSRALMPSCAFAPASHRSSPALVIGLVDRAPTPAPAAPGPARHPCTGTPCHRSAPASPPVARAGASPAGACLACAAPAGTNPSTIRSAPAAPA